MQALEQLAYEEAKAYPRQTAMLLSCQAGMRIIGTKLEVLREIKAAGFTKDAVRNLHVKQATRTEKAVEKVLEPYFKESVKRISAIGSFTPDSEHAERQAKKLVDSAFNHSLEVDELNGAVQPVLAEAILRGIVSELTLTREAAKTTAQEFAQRYGIEELDGFAIGDMPQWMLDAADEALQETFEQDYWQKIPETTRDDVIKTLKRAIEEGRSIREIATTITESHGDVYSRQRATAVARTESSGALNAGHNAGINQLNEELDFELGKEWLSVLGTTTRDTHAAADGQVVKADENFTIGGFETPYPAHYSLPAEERINCQCTEISSIVGGNLDGEEAREQADEGNPEDI